MKLLSLISEIVSVFAITSSFLDFEENWKGHVFEESHGTESEGLFHTVRYHDQMRVRENIEASTMSQIEKLSSAKISRGLSFAATKAKQQ